VSISVLVAAEHALIRAGFKSFLIDSAYEITGEASSVDELFSLHEERRPQILLLDAGLSGRRGLHALEQLREKDRSVRTIVVSFCESDSEVAYAIYLRADHFLSFGITKDDLILVLDGMTCGVPYTEVCLINKLKKLMLRQKFHYNESERRLTQQEKSVLTRAAMGLTNREIANLLHIGLHTVTKHIKSILRKTCSRDRTAAAVWACRRGLLDLQLDNSQPGHPRLPGE